MKGGLYLALAIGLGSGCRTLARIDAAQRRDAADAATWTWSEPSRVAAAKLIADYGPPDEIKPFQLTWKKNGPWKKTIVWNLGSDPGTVTGGDLIEQTVEFAVPPARLAALAAFSGKLRVSHGGTALSVRGAGEPLNFLTANLAVAVARGMSPEQARLFHEKTVDLAASGKSSRYLQGLHFAPKD